MIFRFLFRRRKSRVTKRENAEERSVGKKRVFINIRECNNPFKTQTRKPNNMHCHHHVSVCHTPVHHHSPCATNFVTPLYYSSSSSSSNFEASSVTPASLRPATKEGFLTKQGEIVRNWKRRWFVLKNKMLYYFESKTVSTSNP